MSVRVLDSQSQEYLIRDHVNVCHTLSCCFFVISGSVAQESSWLPPITTIHLDVPTMEHSDRVVVVAGRFQATLALVSSTRTDFNQPERSVPPATRRLDPKLNTAWFLRGSTKAGV